MGQERATEGSIEGSLAKRQLCSRKKCSKNMKNLSKNIFTRRNKLMAKVGGNTWDGKIYTPQGEIIWRGTIGYRGNILKENIKCLQEKHSKEKNSRHGVFFWKGSTL